KKRRRKEGNSNKIEIEKKKTNQKNQTKNKTKIEHTHTDIHICSTTKQTKKCPPKKEKRDYCFYLFMDLFGVCLVCFLTQTCDVTKDGNVSFWSGLVLTFVFTWWCFG